MHHNDQTTNRSIGCSVDECKHHCGDAQYCTLEQIQVGKCELDATTCECTECASFEKKM